MGDVVPFAERRRARRKAVGNLRAPTVQLSSDTVAGILQLLDRPVPKVVDTPREPVRVRLPAPTITSLQPPVTKSESQDDAKAAQGVRTSSPSCPESAGASGGRRSASEAGHKRVAVTQPLAAEAEGARLIAASLSATQIKSEARRAFRHLRTRRVAVRYYNTSTANPLFNVGDRAQPLTAVELIAHAHLLGMKADDAQS